MKKTKRVTKKPLKSTTSLLENKIAEFSASSIESQFNTALIQAIEPARIEFIIPVADEDLFPKLQIIFNKSKAIFQLVEKTSDRQIRVVISK